MEIHAFNHSLATFCQFTTLGYKFFRNTKNPPPMKIMRNLSAFAALCQRIAMNSLILVILAQKGKLKSQDFIHRNDFSDSALQTFRLSPKERIKSYALTALQFRSIVLPHITPTPPQEAVMVFAFPSFSAVTSSHSFPII